MTIKVKIEGEAELQKKLSFNNTFKGPIKNGIKELAFKFEREAKKASPRDTSRMASSISTQLRDASAIVGTNVQYAPFIEFGTKPHFPPLDALRAWLGKKGRPPKSAAFAIALKISREGTKPFHLVGRSKVEGEGPFTFALSKLKIRGTVNNIGKDAQGRWKR